MREIIIQGRGGQGAQTAGNLLAQAFFRQGLEVQAFSTYGGARRGTPVSAFIRVADTPIRRRCDIQRADAILCFDASLLAGPLLERATQQTLVLVNSPAPASEYQGLAGARFYTIDGLALARDNGLGRFVNAGLVGAFAALLEAPALAALQAVIAESTPVLQTENVNGCREGYQRMQQAL